MVPLQYAGDASLRIVTLWRTLCERLCSLTCDGEGSCEAVHAAMDSYTNITPDGGEEFGYPARADGRHMDWAFTQSPFALAIHDSDLLCVRVNDRMCQMFGLTEDQLRGRRLTDVLPGPQYGALERYMRQVLDTGEPTHRETYRRVPGETRERAWSVSVSPLKDQAGRTQAVWIGVLNITEQYAARQRLTLLNQAGTCIGTTLDVTRTAQELADMVVPRFADLAVVDLLDAVLSGDEPDPGPLTGTSPSRCAASPISPSSRVSPRPWSSPETSTFIRNPFRQPVAWPPARRF